MVIRGTPDNIEDYYIADGEIARLLHAKGFQPMYKDYEAVYFKRNKKLIKFLKENDLDSE